ncbi:LytTR family transcriptional regulator [Pseudoalteromonas sp. SG41-5]|uniref:LytR/AlgR family response regulator transcription factor n=1 Tax=Pseudoalteromonas sp. SG41-5 TaxID=2760975 RepID=UPI001601B646|nr:LytTR family DNA-binding domain-containing protein [Pseudoalteromonas sp. SG41-5]MBB1471190.1 LytTR family transcriptional regulator [Pseudoalteromonas sp. SG41-5]
MKLWLKDDLDSKKTLIQRAMLFSVVTLVILFLFQPFGTHSDTISYKYLRLSGYGLVTFCALLLAGFIEILLSRRRLNSHIRKGLIATLYIGFVAVFNHSYFVVAILGVWHWQNQLLFVFYILAIGLFPIIFMFLVNRHSVAITQSQPIALESSQAKNARLTLEKQITLRGDNKDDIVQVSLSQILFIKSADNYCELGMLEDENCSRKLLRGSLTKLLKQLPADAQVVRCHRSYAVNLGLVKLWQGNAGGLQLTMQAGDLVVPVSRTYVEATKKALSFAPKAC